jgi:beta-lactamase class A
MASATILMKSDLSPRQQFNRYLILALALLLGFALGLLSREFFNKKSNRRFVEIRQTGYEFVDPLLDCEQAGDETASPELRPFQQNVNNFIQKDLDKKWADEVSVYFRELNDGRTFTIGKTEEFYPASLMKVPIMMSLLKEAEANPQILKHGITYNKPELKAIQNDIPRVLEFGKTYTVDELLSRMIIYSDNISTNLLENFVKIDDLEKTFTDLGMNDPYRDVDQSRMHGTSTKYMISAETYASFFRVLFNASYLSRPMSEKALALLAQSDFKEGLVAGVPAGIKVAHKYGIRTTGARGEIKQMHDCGIVYYPDHPYLLCVMTSGKSYAYLDDAIKEISRIIYQEVDKQHR